jgi:osmotically-inducible protein OsmY
MNWRDERLYLQLEWALSEANLLDGADVTALVHEGIVELTGQLSTWAELTAILDACVDIPGLAEITCRLAIAESMPENWPEDRCPRGFQR